MKNMTLKAELMMLKEDNDLSESCKDGLSLHKFIHLKIDQEVK